MDKSLITSAEQKNSASTLIEPQSDDQVSGKKGGVARLVVLLTLPVILFAGYTILAYKWSCPLLISEEISSNSLTCTILTSMVLVIVFLRNRYQLKSVKSLVTKSRVIHIKKGLIVASCILSTLFSILIAVGMVHWCDLLKVAYLNNPQNASVAHAYNPQTGTDQVIVIPGTATHTAPLCKDLVPDNTLFALWVSLGVVSGIMTVYWFALVFSIVLAPVPEDTRRSIGKRFSVVSAF